jgi:hypothetical protein
MTKFFTFLLIFCLLCNFSFAAQAATLCRHQGDRIICILNIKRSAKNHWQYLASISIDGVEKPTEVYNCRDRTKTQKDGTNVSFEINGAGKLICSLFK